MCFGSLLTGMQTNSVMMWPSGQTECCRSAAHCKEALWTPTRAKQQQSPASGLSTPEARRSSGNALAANPASCAAVEASAESAAAPAPPFPGFSWPPASAGSCLHCLASEMTVSCRAAPARSVHMQCLPKGVLHVCSGTISPPKSSTCLAMRWQGSVVELGLRAAFSAWSSQAHLYQGFVFADGGMLKNKARCLLQSTGLRPRLGGGELLLPQYPLQHKIRFCSQALDLPAAPKRYHVRAEICTTPDCSRMLSAVCAPHGACCMQ